MWADDHVLAYRPVPRGIGGTSGGSSDVPGGASSASLSRTPRYCSGFSIKSGRVSPIGN